MENACDRNDRLIPMTKWIRPDLLKCYQYQCTLSPDKSRFDVRIPLPTGIDPKSIRVRANAKSIVVSLEDEIPFFAGKLFGPLLDRSHTVEDDFLVVKLFKDPKVEWPILVVEPAGKALAQIDPQSAVGVSIYLSAQGGPSAQSASVVFLQHAMNCGFPRAAIVFAQLLIENHGDIGQVMPTLLQMVDIYHDAEACAFLGVLSLTGRISMEHGMKALTLGAADNDPECSILLGLSLSPLEEPLNVPKDPVRAFELFSRFPDNPRAKYGMGKLLCEGIGCEKNEKLGIELIAQARAADQELPEYRRRGAQQQPERALHPVQEQPAEEGSGSWFGGWGVAVGAFAVIALTGGAFALARKWKK
jgi:hypothetical protein